MIAAHVFHIAAVGQLRYRLGLGSLAIRADGYHPIVAPDADPFILPIVMVLNGLGIAMIYRIGLADQLEGGIDQYPAQVAMVVGPRRRSAAPGGAAGFGRGAG